MKIARCEEGEFLGRKDEYERLCKRMKNRRVVFEFIKLRALVM